MITEVILSIIALAVIWLVLQPIIRREKRIIDINEVQREGLDNLLLQKEIVFAELKDLDFEKAMGRIADSDYDRLRHQYKLKAETIVQHIDMLGHSAERDDWIEKEIQARRRDGEPSTSTRCAKCGTMNMATNRFCTRCGTQLTTG